VAVSSVFVKYKAGDEKINFLLPFVCVFFFPRARHTNKQLRPSTRCARYYAKTPKPNNKIRVRVLIIANMRKEVQLWPSLRPAASSAAIFKNR
jgi:hypothetical protein